MVGLPKAARMNLALQTCEKDPKLRPWKAARIYNVSLMILSLRRASRTPRSDTTPNSRKLDQLEEEALVEYILKLDSQEYSPRFSNVGDWPVNCFAGTHHAHRERRLPRRIYQPWKAFPEAITKENIQGGFRWTYSF